METAQEVERKEGNTPQPSVADFIGRSDLLDTVKQHLLKGQHVCLYGDRRMGKR